MTEEKRRLKVFLCHASTDKPQVEALYRRFVAEGWIDPWLDAARLLPGQHWSMVIKQALAEADSVIVFVSHNSVDREGFLQREMNLAWDLSLEKPRSAIYLIPLRLEDCDVPYELRERQWADYFGEKQEATYLALLQSLELRYQQKLKIEAEDAAQSKREQQVREQAECEMAEKTASKQTEPKAAEKTTHKTLGQESTVEVFSEQVSFMKAALERNERIAQANREKAPALKVALERDEQTAREIAAKYARNSSPAAEPEKEPQKTGFGPAGQRKKLPPLRRIKTEYVAAIIGAIATIIAGLLSSPLLERLFSPIPILTITLTHTILAPSTTPRQTITNTPISPPQTPTPSLTPIESFTPTTPPLPYEITDVKGVNMRLIPAGSFIMGDKTDDALAECKKYYDGVGATNCQSDWFTDEEPFHQVTLDAFYMDVFEVTNALYKACADEGICTLPNDTASYTRSNYYGNSRYGDYPVINVNWNQAKTYCEWRGVRLPTEAEWEKAARGTDGRTYPWGNEAPDCQKANFLGKNGSYCVGDTTKVGSYPAGVSPYGIYDLSGNVWEWVNDWYNGDYYQNSPVANPFGPASGSERILRGGSWDVTYLLRVSYRVRDTPNYSNINLGFRCAAILKLSK